MKIQIKLSTYRFIKNEIEEHTSIYPKYRMVDGYKQWLLFKGDKVWSDSIDGHEYLISSILAEYYEETKKYAERNLQRKIKDLLGIKK
jgi:hypothetical protein